MLKNKVAIITGATRGIGFATAKLFLENHAKVVILGSKKDSVDKALENLNRYKDNILGYYPDLKVEEEIIKVFEEVYNKFGSIDILVNNAGVSSAVKLEDYKDNEFQNIIDLNVNAVYICSKIATKFMKENNGGVILNTSSMVSLYGQSSGSAYPTSKFAVNGLTKSLARELGKYQIRVNAVAPGVVETDMVKSLPKEIIDPIVNKIPLGRMAQPIDIANAFLYLASPMANFVTGAILSVDGAGMD